MSTIRQFQPDSNGKPSSFGNEKIGSSIFHNARSMHTCIVTMSNFHELEYELLSQPPYSTDLAPSNYILFPNMKKSLSGNKFGSIDEVFVETNAYFVGLKQSYFSQRRYRREKNDGVRL